MSRTTNVLCILGGALIAACGSAQVVSQTQTGGVIRLQGDRGKAMEEARGIMGQHCGGQYEIVKQGETVIGSDTVRSDETYATEEGSVVNEGGTSTRQATEWRVTYQCAGAAPAPAPAPPPAPAAPAPPADPGAPAPPADPPPGDGY